MKCYRKGCEEKATVLPALPCKDKLGGNVMWAMGVPHCDGHTVGACVDAMMTEPAWAQLTGMIRREGIIPPERETRLQFIPLSKFGPSQLAQLASS